MQRQEKPPCSATVRLCVVRDSNQSAREQYCHEVSSLPASNSQLSTACMMLPKPCSCNRQCDHVAALCTVCPCQSSCQLLSKHHDSLCLLLQVIAEELASDLRKRSLGLLGLIREKPSDVPNILAWLSTLRRTWSSDIAALCRGSSKSAVRESCCASCCQQF